MNLILIVLVLLLTLHSNAQEWYNKVINNQIMISFPYKPEDCVIANGTKEKYLCRQNGCRFMVGVLPKALQNYDSYLKMPDTLRQVMVMSLIESVAKEKICYNNQNLISIRPFGSRGYYGLDIEYEIVELPSIDKQKCFSTLLLVNNTIYAIDCCYMDGRLHDFEKENFFKSVKINSIVE